MYFIPDTVESGYVLDFRGSYFDRVYAQYRTKKKASEWYGILRFLADGLSVPAYGVRSSYNIDMASGEILDVIGRVVVASRNFIAMPELYPGLFDLTDGDQFGDDDAMFSETSVGTDSVMSNALYRLVIKSKISKNNGDATFESILDAVSFLLPSSKNLRIIDDEAGSFQIEYSGRISDLEKWALTNNDLVPRPLGITFTGFVEVPDGD